MGLLQLAGRSGVRWPFNLPGRFFSCEADHAVWTITPGWDPITMLLLSACFYLALTWIFLYPDSIYRHISQVNARCKWDPWVGSSVILPDRCEVWLVTKLKFPTSCRLYFISVNYFHTSFPQPAAGCPIMLLAKDSLLLTKKKNGSWPSSPHSVFFFFTWELPGTTTVWTEQLRRDRYLAQVHPSSAKECWKARTDDLLVTI